MYQYGDVVARPALADKDETYVVHDDDLARSQELLRDDDAAQGIAHAAPGITNDVGIALFQTQGSGGI